MQPAKKLGKMGFDVEDAVFKHTVHIFFNFADEDMKRESAKRKWNFDMSYGKRAGYSLQFERKGCYDEWVIAIKDFNWTCSHMGVLVHEIHHTVVNILELHNVKVGGDTQEFSALMEGQMFEEIAWKIHKKQKG